MRVETIGRGTDRRDGKETSFELGICFDDADRPIFLSEGSGIDSFGGTLSLQQLRDPHFLRRLEQCGCAWLVRLAEEEEQRARHFSPDEIFGRWRQRC
jgi:hypothetical protein